MLNVLRKLHRDKRGVTGLETAIILIAFVVVASVFAYTVLSAGIFSSQKGKEAIYSGLEQASSSMEVEGNVIAKDTGGTGYVNQVVFTVANALGGDAIDLTAPTDANADGLADAGSSNVTVISYADSSEKINDLAWTATEVGKGNGDHILDPGEKFQITVDLTAAGATEIGPYHNFTLEVKPPKGSVLTMSETTPARIDSVMSLQ